MRTSKIARFPRQIREQLNQRLDSSDKTRLILAWLTSLPEVQAILAAEFAGEPVKQQNLDGWKKTGFRNWQLRQAALEFTQDAPPDDIDTSQLEKIEANPIRCLKIP